MRLTIRPKLLLVFLGAVVLALVLTVAAFIMMGFLLIPGEAPGVRYNALTVTRTFDQGAREVERVLAAGGDQAAVRAAALDESLPPHLRVMVVARDGRVWVDNQGPEGVTIDVQEVLTWVQGVSPNESFIHVIPTTLRVGGEVWGYYAISIPEGLMNGVDIGASAQADVAAWVLLGGPLLALVASLLLFWFFGWHLVKPVRRISAVVSQIAAGDLSARVNPGKRGDELGQLARDIDTMGERLLAAREQATAMEEARRYFVAAASHDLRTPLTALLAHAEALRAGVAEEPAQALAVIEEKGLQLKRLTDDLFELAALDASAQRWQMVRQNVAELVRRAVIGQLPELEAAGFAVDVEIPEEPLWASVAPGKLERVIDNLLANARKYGAEGRWVGVRAEQRGARVRVEVLDRGPGIAEAERERVFERFYRSDGARGGAGSSGAVGAGTAAVATGAEAAGAGGHGARTASGGSGLGLAIAREIVLRHGGEIGVSAPTGGGACFWFELPAVL